MPSLDAPGIEGFGYRLRAARLRLQAERVSGVTQAALGSAVEVTEGAYGHWENGRAYPDLPTVVQLAALLGVNPAWLAFGEGKRDADADATLSVRAKEMTGFEIQTAKPAKKRGKSA